MNTPLQNPHGDSHFLAYYVPILISTYTRQSRRLLRFIHKQIAAKASFIHTHHILQPCREHQQKLLLDRWNDG